MARGLLRQQACRNTLACDSLRKMGIREEPGNKPYSTSLLSVLGRGMLAFPFLCRFLKSLRYPSKKGYSFYHMYDKNEAQRI